MIKITFPDNSVKEYAKGTTPLEIAKSISDRLASDVLAVIGYTGLKDTSPHGVVFRGMIDNLNRKYGWDIRVITSTKGWKVSERVTEKKKAKGPQTYLMLAIELKDGKFYLSRVNPGFARRIEKQLPMVRELRSHRWYTTQESYFDDYPQVRSLRGRRITKGDFEKLQNVLTPFEL